MFGSLSTRKNLVNDKILGVCQCNKKYDAFKFVIFREKQCSDVPPSVE